MKTVRFLAAGLLVCSWGSSRVVAAQTQAASIHRLDGTTIAIADADAFARKTLAEQHVTGAEIAVIDEGKLVWSGAFGLRRKEPELPMDRETTMWAASITKSVFTTYVMQLVERGEFSLDVPVAKQLAQPLDRYDAYKERASELVRDPRWATVTPRMLLSHSSGLQNFAAMEPDKKMHLHLDPGSGFLDSGDGINQVQFATALLAGALLKPETQAEMLKPVLALRSVHEFSPRANEGEGKEAAAVGLAHGVGWGLLTKTRFGPAFFKEGHGDDAQNSMTCRRETAGVHDRADQQRQWRACLSRFV
jgi:CubicO group peptidase (beta-lactamase class C family)